MSLVLARDKRIGWQDRVYFRLKYWARIPEMAPICEDHYGRGVWRWFYLAPFLVVRRLLRGGELGSIPRTLGWW